MEQAAKVILSCLLAFNAPVFADSGSCPQNVQVIHQNEKANCDGFLFSGPAEQAAEQDRDDSKYYKSLSDALQSKTDLQAEENQILEKRLKLYMDSTQSLSQDVAKRDSTETWVRLGYFVLGVLGTSLVVRNLRP